MIDRNCLKKGDKVLIVNSDYLRTREEKPEEVYVTTLGKKYIGVQSKDFEGKLYGPVEKFYNDERMGKAEWGQKRLFLGTIEEYEQEKELAKKTHDMYLYVNCKVSETLGWEKLEAIKAIIESDSVADAMDKISCMVVNRKPEKSQEEQQ